MWDAACRPAIFQPKPRAFGPALFAPDNPMKPLSRLSAALVARGGRRGRRPRSSSHSAERAAAAVRHQHHRRLRRLVRQPGRQPQLPRRLPESQSGAARSTCRSARTTASSPAAPTWASRRISCPAGRSACSSSRCPKEFTPQQRLTWTITVNGQTNSIPLRMHTDYNVSPFKIQHSGDAGEHAAGDPVRRGGATDPGTDRDGLASRSLTRTTVGVDAAGARRLGGRRREVLERHERADAQSAAAGDAHLVEVPRPRQGDVRQGQAGDCEKLAGGKSASRSAASARRRRSSASRASTSCT